MAEKNTANRQVQLKRKKSKKRKRYRPGLISFLLLLVLIGAYIFFFYQLKAFNILPETYFIAAAALVGLILLFFIFLWFVKTRGLFTRFLCLVLSAAISVGLFTLGGYIQLTDNVLNQITDFTSNNKETVTTVVLKDKGIDSLADLNGKKIALLSSQDPEAMEEYKKNIQNKTGAQLVEYEYLFPAAAALYSENVDAIALPENLRQTLHETSKYYEFQFLTKDIDKIQFETENSQSLINYPDPVGNVTEDPFTILISGNDSYGGLEPVARSDVNMLVTINPKTAQVLITSIPRDSYVYVTCKKDETACTPGSVDKLTHSGLTGIATTESTIEDFMDVQINYTMRINFSSLTKLVDAIGGIDVYVDKGLAVEQFWTNPNQGVREGWNHLDGEGALAYSRERYSYQDGDLQRIRNQQNVIEALLKKLLSPSMVIHYPALMDTLSVACETNLSLDDIRSLIKMQITRWPSWDIHSYSLRGWVNDAWSSALQDYASVTNLYDEAVDAGTAKIHAVLDGENPDLIKDPTFEEDEQEGLAPEGAKEEPAAVKNPESYWG